VVFTSLPVYNLFIMVKYLIYFIFKILKPYTNYKHTKIAMENLNSEIEALIFDLSA